MTAQVFSLVDLDISNFPIIRSRLILSDNSGQSIRNLQPTDFEILENGQPRTILQVFCKPIEERKPIQVVLVADKSMSMANHTADGVTTRMELLKQSMSEFLDAVEFVQRTEIALTAFDAEAYLIAGFQGSASYLKTALQGLEPSQRVGTNYEAAFLDPAYGAIPLMESQPNPDNNRRAIVFFTDGQPIPPSSFDYNVVDEIITRAQLANIEIYPITLDLRMHPDLRRIARETGGLAFEQLKTVEEVKAIYRLIADRLQGVEACEIIWQSDVGCGATSRIRSVEATYLPLALRTTTVYTAPDNSVATLDVSSFVLGFGNPIPGDTVYRDLQLTAHNADFTISTVQLTGAGNGFFVKDWGGSPPPFVISQGTTRTLRLGFVGQPQQSFQIQTLQIDAAPCPVEVITLWGGRPGQADAPVQLLSPVGGEIFASCDSVAIRWGGIPAYQPVSLWYSTDGGSTWQLITDNATGYRYIWVPPAPGQRYMIRVQAHANVPIWRWTIAGAHAQQEQILSLSSNTDEAVVALGHFEGQPIQFGDSVQISSGRAFLLLAFADGIPQDVVEVPASAKQVVLNDQGYVFVLMPNSIAQFRIVDSTLRARWRRSYTDPLFRDTLKQITLDPQGRCYLLRTSLELLPGNTQLWRSFIERINLTGTVVERFQLPDIRATRFAVDIDGNYIVTGRSYANTLVPRGKFIAKFNSSGQLLWHYLLGDNVTTTALATDITGTIYQSGFFSGMANFPHRSITSYGATDGMLLAYAPDGTPRWSHHFYTVGSFDDQLWDLVVNRSGQLFITGTFKGRTLYRNGEVTLRKSQNRFDAESFIAAFDEQGEPLWWMLNEGIRDDRITTLSPDPQFGVFAGGWYQSPKLQCYPYELSNAGQSDFLIGQVVPLPGGKDQSDTVFTIEAPQLRIAAHTLDFGMVPVGQQAILFDTICNEGTLPVEIVLSITQLNFQDFAVLVAVDTLTILPGECLPLKVLFQPLKEGVRRTFLDIFSPCLGTVSVELRGEGGTPCTIVALNSADVVQIAAGKDTTFTIPNAFCNQNNYPLSLSISLAGPGATYYTLLSPATAQLQPGECYTAQLRLSAPQQPGPLPSAWLEYAVPEECDDPITRLIAVILPIPPQISAIVPTPLQLLCPDSTDTTQIAIHNGGQEPLVVSAIDIDVPPIAATILTPLPLSIYAGEWDTVTIAYRSPAVGVFTGTIRIHSNDSARSPLEHPITIEVPQIQLAITPNPLNLGTLLRDQFPLTRTVTLRNTGTIPITIRGGTADGVTLRTPDGNPVVLLPDDSVRVEVIVTAQAIGSFSVMVPLTMEPQCSPQWLSVEGTVARPAIGIQAPQLELDPHQRNVRIPIIFQGPAGGIFNRTIALSVEIDPAVFFIRRIEGAQQVQRTIRAQQQIATFAVPLANLTTPPDTLWVVGDALLGDRDFSPILLSVAPQDTAIFEFHLQPGTIQLVNICEEGGKRLLRSPWDVTFGVHVQIAPPEAVEFTANVVEIGQHTLQIYDLRGRLLWQQPFQVAAPVPAQYQFRIATRNWQSGLYYCILRTPTQHSVQKIWLVR